MPPANARLIDDFRQLREEAGLVERIRGIRRLGLYRQAALGPASLYAAAALSKW